MREGTTQQVRPVSRSELPVLLMERAEHLRDFVRRRIPARLQRVISPEDILQEVWLAAFRCFFSFRSDRPNAFDRWLTKIAERKLLDALRGARRFKRDGLHRFAPVAHPRKTSWVDLFSRVASNHRTPSSEDAAKEAVDAVQIALCDLPDDHRRAITMYHLQGRTRAEVAMLLQRSDSAVSNLLYRGLRMLRHRLGPEGKFFSDEGRRRRN